jgi:hypothetical protein
MSHVDRKRVIKPPALKDLEVMPASKRMKKAALPTSPHAVIPKARSDAKARPSAPSAPRPLKAEVEEETTATNANHNK